jgi:endonuclease/exonuclease/phosphatase (EEP) superfamily protein YafD
MGVSFRLMSANLLHEHCDVDDFERVLDETQPDVIVIQELGHDCADVLATLYPNRLLRPANDFTGHGMASRFDTVFEELATTGHPGIGARVDVEGTPLAVTGLHLPNPLDFPWWATARTRSIQIEAVFEWISDQSEMAAIVAGDFNASPIWPAYRKLATRLTDLVDEWAVAEEREPEPTWAWHAGWPRVLRIDHVFGSGVRAANVAVEPIVGSDHAAVIADLTFTS